MFHVNLEGILHLIKSKEEAQVVVSLSLLLVQLRAFLRGYQALSKHENVRLTILLFIY
jgi:hypothetical protein